MRHVDSIGDSLISDALEELRKNGVRNLCKKIWVYIWVETLLASIAIPIMGELTHEKIAQSMSVGYWPQIRNPRSFNEKIAHRKLFTNDDIFTTVSDKYAVREYVRERVGGEVLNTVYHVTDDPDTIPFDSLPSTYVVKSTHSSGQIQIIDNNKERDADRLRSICADWLDTEFGQERREYWYSNIQPRILVERRIKDPQFHVPVDFKFFVFNGNVEYIQVITDRFTDVTERFYDENWNLMDFTRSYEKGPDIEKPDELAHMIDIAESLGSDFQFIRVDLYQTGNGVIFSELTVAPGAGYLWFTPKKWDFKFGKLW